MTTRHIVELLQLLDKEVDGPHFATGLCGLINNLTNHTFLTYDENTKLFHYLRDVSNKTIHSYWWEEGLREPRHKWLRKRIRIEKIKKFLRM